MFFHMYMGFITWTLGWHVELHFRVTCETYDKSPLKAFSHTFHMFSTCHNMFNCRKILLVNCFPTCVQHNVHNTCETAQYKLVEKLVFSVICGKCINMWKKQTLPKIKYLQSENVPRCKTCFSHVTITNLQLFSPVFLV